jgi:hypothetical protein
MRGFVLSLALTLCAAVSSPHAAGDYAFGEKNTRVPVLLELFTSEGCSSCPPADSLLEVFDQKQPVQGADLIVLSEHVDYWNRLGWTDPFSAAQYSARQQEYSDRFNLSGPYTPQLVVDGRFEINGSNSREAGSAIQKALREQKIAISISQVARNGNQISAHIELPAAPQSAKGTKAVLYIALADNRAESQVARGENAGRALAHVSVTRVLKQVGKIDLDNVSTRDVTLSVLPGAGSNGLRLVAFVQDAKSGHVLGVTAQKL